MKENNYPKLHNASWPGVVGKGPDSEPPISIDTMIDLTANAEVDGVKFDGFDLFLSDPHMDIDSSNDGIKKMADKAMAKTFKLAASLPRFGPQQEVGQQWEPRRSALNLLPRYASLATSLRNCVN